MRRTPRRPAKAPLLRPKKQPARLLARLERLLAAFAAASFLICLGGASAFPAWRTVFSLVLFVLGALLLLETKRLKEDLRVRQLGAVSAMALAMEARDPYTQGHCLRVRHLTRRILERLGMPPRDRASAETAALLHDLGKIGVPDAILYKDGPLTPEERSRLMLHVDIGVEILAPVAEMEDVSLLVRHHHERFDGSGYPDGTRGEDIPLGSRVIAVADAIDAMRTTRPYRPAMPWEDVIRELRAACGT
ncbi:MAG: HD-GYP domain-containing protein [Planctomycetes bacterium]|nr:HD-GYP domain-containing protein [Planctomycetota bacterium]